MFFLAGLLKSGLSLEQAFHVVIEDFPDPMKTFLRKRCERRQGTVQDRIEQIFSGADLKFARAVLLLSGRTGSSAGLLLDKSAKAMRRKQELTEKMKVLSAQGKVSAWVVAHASFLLLLTFYFFMPEFISPLFETREGWFILVSILVLNLLGLFVAHRMIRLD
jgi:tight adherence protein B